MRPISPRRVFALLLIIIGALVVANLAAQVFRFHFGHDHVKGFVPLFSVDREHNFPTWFTSILLFLSAGLLGGIATARRAAGGRFARHWTILAGGALLMSIDEVTEMHEAVVEPLRATIEVDSGLGLAWVVVGLALLALLGIYYRRFVAELPAPSKRLVLAAAVFYVGGALGLDTVGGAWADTHTRDNMTYNLIALTEGTFEMLGAALFVRGVLTYIAAEWREIRIPLATETAPARMRSGWFAREFAAVRRRTGFILRPRAMCRSAP